MTPEQFADLMAAQARVEANQLAMRASMDRVVWWLIAGAVWLGVLSANQGVVITLKMLIYRRVMQTLTAILAVVEAVRDNVTQSRRQTAAAQSSTAKLADAADRAAGAADRAADAAHATPAHGTPSWQPGDPDRRTGPGSGRTPAP